MIQFHKDIGLICNKVILWRYISIDSFERLIQSSELHFHRIDNYDDREEGVLTTLDKGIFSFFSNSEEYWERERKRHYVSCWIESPHELALMWQAYGNKGVAIKSSVKSLIESFEDDETNKIIMAKVQYKDYDIDSSQINGTPINVLKIVFTKRKYYEQEKEIRLLYSDYFSPKGQEKLYYNLPCHIETLIEEIRLAPNLSCEDENYVRDIIKQHNFKIPILRSEI